MHETYYCFECVMPTLVTLAQPYFVCEYCETMNTLERVESAS